MNHYNNNICCMKVETGALIFAICSAIFTALACLLSVISVFASLYEVFYTLENPRDINAFFPLIITGVLVMSVAFSIVGFVFSMVLAKGILKRKAGYVKAYFIYGVVVVVLLLTTALAVSFLMLNPYHILVPCIATILALLVVTLLYSLVLIMIRYTYKKFEREPKMDCSFVQKLLVEKY